MTRVQPHAGPTTVHGTAHSSATLYEAVQTLLRSKNTATGLSSPRAVDPRIGAAWPGARVAGPAFTVRRGRR